MENLLTCGGVDVVQQTVAGKWLPPLAIKNRNGIKVNFAVNEGIATECFCQLAPPLPLLFFLSRGFIPYQ